MKDDEERIKHPSYGQISFSRVTCTPAQQFYGSELPQDHYISMEVKESEINRTLSKDWHFASGLPLIKIRMSSNQFAELLTSLNVGSGVPCTIEMVNKIPVEKYPSPESRKEFVHRKFEDRMKEFADTIRAKQIEAKELVKKKSLSKADMHQLQMHIEWLTREVERNIPFFAKCFQETMDIVVNEAKSEIENAIQHKITTLGLAELHKRQNLLSLEENGEQP